MATKTVEDYRNSVKILKVKVLKLQKQQEDLMELKAKHGTQLDFLFATQDTTNMLDTMKQLAANTKRIGLTPEMLFRAADQQQLGCISTESMTVLMNKLRLNMSMKQITAIIQLFDIDSSGTITVQEFKDSLEAYGINSEASTQSFAQSAFQKYAKLALANNFDGEVGYNKMDPRESGSFTLEIFKILIQNCRDWTQYISDREIIGAFNFLDILQNSRVTKVNYLREMDKLQRRGKPPPNVTIKKESTENKTRQSQEIIKRMIVLGVNFSEFMSSVLHNIQDLNRGVFVDDFFRAAEDVNLKVSKTDLLRIFQSVDNEEKGSVGYDQLMSFFLKIKSPKDPFDILILILSRKLQALEYSIQDYLALHTIGKDLQMNSDQFYPVSQILFNVPNQNIGLQLFNAMDKDNSKQVSTKEIIDMVNQTTQNSDLYKSILIKESVLVLLSQKDPNPLSQVQFNHKLLGPQRQIQKVIFLGIQSHNMTSNQKPKQIQEIVLDPIKYSQQIKKIKPKLVANDFFFKYQLDDAGKPIEVGTWLTIFNNESACLMRAQEIILDLQRTKDKRWIDPEFGPSIADPYGGKSMYIADNSIMPGCPEPQDVKWLRPEEFNEDAQETMMFDDEGPTSNDVLQSKYLGDCWFISALSIIAGQSVYLRGHYEPTKDLTGQAIDEMSMGVFPPLFQFLNAYRIYVFRFFKNFRWRYVMIDDKIACMNGEIIYARCRKTTEIWVQMIEKAYAKLHNCYQALASGDIAQGLSDMTGYVAHKVDISCNNDEDKKESMWNTLKKVKEERMMIGCSASGCTEEEVRLHDEKTGILGGHAYGIIDLFEIADPTCNNKHKSHRLLRLRNPWGYREWTGKWSDQEDNDELSKYGELIRLYLEAEKTDALKRGLQPPEALVRDVNDGTFLMNFGSWRAIFTTLFMNFDFPDVWSGLRARDAFKRDSSGPPKKDPSTHQAYAQSNAQFIMTINNRTAKETSIFISLGQNDGRLYKNSKYPFQVNLLLLCVYKLEKQEASLQKYDTQRMVYNSKQFSAKREINSGEMKLPNGSYSIIPCTHVYDLFCTRPQQPGQQGEFFISVYFDCAKSSMSLQKFNDSAIKFEIIQEEEETQPSSTGGIKAFLHQLMK